MFKDGLFGWREDKKRRANVEDVAHKPYRAYVEKQILPVVVCTAHQRIEGNMHITYHHRALDILNGLEEFIPITSARVSSIESGELVAERDFVAVNKHTITTLWETGEPYSPQSETEAEPAEGEEPEASSDEPESVEVADVPRAPDEW